MRFSQSRMEGRAEKAADDGREEAEAGGEPRPCRQIVFTGVGPSVSKAITCVEILKRRLGDLHQVTRPVYSSLQESWEPLEPSAGLDAITVTRNVPAIWVLLSRDPLDSDTPGYQAPGSFAALWAQANAKEERENQRRKSGGRGGGGGRGRGARRQATRPRDERKTSGQTSGAH